MTLSAISFRLVASSFLRRPPIRPSARAIAIPAEVRSRISMLALHLLQNCMVYVNTLMVQQVLARPHWAKRLTARDLDALTPLIWDHVNPYGRFDLDMEASLPID